MKRMTLRMSPEQDEIFTKAAKAAGLSKNRYAELAILERAKHLGLGARAPEFDAE